MTLHGGGQLRRLVPDDLVEAVVPEAQHLHERDRPRPCDEFVPGQIEDALDMVVVDVAHHEQVDGQRLVLGEACAHRGSARCVA